MRRLAAVLALMALGLGFVGGCDEGREGHLCDRDEECEESFVCLTQVWNCDGEDCWGTCERECATAADCDGGDICVWVRSTRVCRPSDYQEP